MCFLRHGFYHMYSKRNERSHDLRILEMSSTYLFKTYNVQYILNTHRNCLGEVCLIRFILIFVNSTYKCIIVNMLYNVISISWSIKFILCLSLKRWKIKFWVRILFTDQGCVSSTYRLAWTSRLGFSLLCHQCLGYILGHLTLWCSRYSQT